MALVKSKKKIFWDLFKKVIVQLVAFYIYILFLLHILLIENYSII